MKKLLALLLTVVMICSLAASTAVAHADSGKTVVLKFAHAVAETLPQHQAFVEFAEAVKERTGGAVQIDVYANSQLGGERDIMEGLQLGTIDFGCVSTAVVANFVPEYYLFDTPFLFSDTESTLKVCDSEIGQGMADKLHSSQGIRQVGFLDIGGRNVFSTKPVETIDDFKGLKIRVMENDLHIALFNAVGAQATPMAFSELYTALQQGTVDAGENSLMGIKGSGFDDICKYISITNHVYGINVLLLGDLAYQKIPEEYRDIVMEEAWNCVLNERVLVGEANQKAISQMEENGCTVYTLDHEALMEKVTPIYDKFADQLPTELIAQAQAMLAE